MIAGDKVRVETFVRVPTRVTLEHRGFAGLRDDHPVRHGKAVDVFIRDLGMWWAALLTSLRERGEDR